MNIDLNDAGKEIDVIEGLYGSLDYMVNL